MTRGRGWIAGGDRFASPPMVVAAIACGLVLASVGTFRVHGDGVVYLAFLRRLLGMHEPVTAAYQFGAAFWNAPFYLVGVAFGAGDVAIGVAAAVAALAALYAGWHLLAAFELPRGPLVLLLTFFGTPIWFYVFFEPSYTHAFDVLVWTSAALLLARAVRGGGIPVLVALGVCVGALPLVRYANVAAAPWFLLPLLLGGRRRSAALAAGVAALTLMIVAMVPILAGIPYGRPPAAVNAPPPHAALDLLAPAKMLFTLHRGLFLWTPLAAAGVVGFVALLRRLRADRLVLGSLAGAAVSLLVVHVAWGNWWDAGFSFSQRFLAGLFPLYLLGVAELVRRFRVTAVGVAAAAVAFSLFVGINVNYGYRGQSETDGVDVIVGLYVDGRRSLPQLARIVGVDVRDRWQELAP